MVTASAQLLSLLAAVCGGVTLLPSLQSLKCSGCFLLPSYTDIGVTNELLSLKSSLYCEEVIKFFSEV